MHFSIVAKSVDTEEVEGIDDAFAREEMSRERLHYLEAMVYEALEHKLVVAEANQRLRLPLISKDGEIQEEEIEKCSIMSRSSLDNPGVGGVPNRFFGITVVYLRKTQLQPAPLSTDMAEYQMSLFHAIESRLKAKCDKLADACILDEFDVSSTGNPNTSARPPESLHSSTGHVNKVKLIIEDIKREETALQEDLYSVDRKFVEYYNFYKLIDVPMSNCINSGIKKNFILVLVQLFLPQPSPSCTYNFGNGVSFGDGFVENVVLLEPTVQVEKFFSIIIMWWAVVASIWVAYKNSTMLWWCDLCCFGGDNSGGVDLGYCGRCRFQVGVTMDSGKDEEMRRTIRAQGEIEQKSIAC
ncbi:unnamed protein product [Ilex paraguariensis]|uniref:Uncharacterized protein n=1 Tax=Ilex paraguariensis TaxID=185542 RepID=A0ABC8U3E4_9AQUA